MISHEVSVEQLKSLEAALQGFASKHEELSLEIDEILAINTENYFYRKQVCFTIFKADESELLFTLERCCIFKNILNEKLTKYCVDEVEYLAYDDVDYFVVFFDINDKPDFLNLIESIQ